MTSKPKTTWHLNNKKASGLNANPKVIIPIKPMPPVTKIFPPIVLVLRAAKNATEIARITAETAAVI
jgi:hypothetical protein